jgi:hypothetical protein
VCFSRLDSSGVTFALGRENVRPAHGQRHDHELGAVKSRVRSVGDSMRVHEHVPLQHGCLAGPTWRSRSSARAGTNGRDHVMARGVPSSSASKTSVATNPPRPGCASQRLRGDVGTPTTGDRANLGCISQSRRAARTEPSGIAFRFVHIILRDRALWAGASGAASSSMEVLRGTPEHIGPPGVRPLDR